MKTIKYNDKTYTIPKPFNECYFGKEPTKEHTITNPYSNQSTTIPAFAQQSMTRLKVLNKLRTMT